MTNLVNKKYYSRKSFMVCSILVLMFSPFLSLASYFDANGFKANLTSKEVKFKSIKIDKNDLLLSAATSRIEIQEFVVSGTVMDNEGNPLPGANILEEGTTNGTQTDFDGKFTLTVINKDAVLLVSYMGFQTAKMPIEGSKDLEIALEQDADALDEVIVVGYGTQKKATLTGAVSTMSSDDITESPVSNVANALAGKLPGLVAVQRSGEPGLDTSDLSIRGLGSPLVVVDGVVGRDFSQLDPNSIESITILKDAASTAVYGVSGGSGVIIVTTKQGDIGKPTFTYNISSGIQTVTKYPDFVNSAEYATLKNEASVNLGGDIIYTPEEIELYRLGTDPNYPNFDYYDYFVRNSAPQRQQNISVSGGSKLLKYYFLLGETHQESMWKVRGGDDNNGGDDIGFSRYNFQSNVVSQITDDLEISVGFAARWENRDQLIQSSYLMSSWMQYQWPIEAPKTPDGMIKSTNYGLAAYLDRDLTGYVIQDERHFQGNLTIKYDLPFVKGLSAKIMGSRDEEFGHDKNWIKQYSTYEWDAATETSVQVGTRGVNSLTLETDRIITSNIQASLNYNRTFLDKHNVGALLLYEERETEGIDFLASRVNYVVPIDQLFAGPDTNKNNNGSAFDNGRKSVVGRLQYDFQEKYLFEYSFRYDGSARFPVDTRWGMFNGISAGWRISEEKFIKNHSTAINDLKVRASWGQSGNDDTGDFQFLTGYTYPAYNYILGDNIVTLGMVDTGIPNPNITWETSEMFNIGFNLNMWNSLLTVDADFFYRVREGRLATRSLQIPSTFGASLPAENLNADNTRGFELALSHFNTMGQLSYTISPNISLTRSKWDHFEQRPFTSQYDNWRNGLSDRWGNRTNALKAIGQFQSEEEIRSSPIQDAMSNSTLRPGDIKYDDYNNDGYITSEDSQLIGKGETPEIMYGLGMAVSWKGFGLSMTWQGAANYTVTQGSYLIYPFNNGMNSYDYFMDRWHRADLTDPDSEWIPGKYPSTVNAGAPNNKQQSSFWIEDASYLRLKYLNIGYDIPLPEDQGIDINVSLSGTNLLTFSGLDYIDPEAPSGRLSYYPQMAVYSLGLNVKF